MVYIKFAAKVEVMHMQTDKSNDAKYLYIFEFK
jgi:hypothetical protein